MSQSDRTIIKLDAVPKMPVQGAKPKPFKMVAAYARVSTGHDDQQNSFEAQIDYYTKMIAEHADWKLVKIYSDEGISGCNTRHRAGFNTMMEDCEAGKIDLILTKSVSRFARNTVDSVSAIRKLKSMGIGVYFEKENIWTFDSKGELLLTIMSSLAQEESRSISENVTWGQRKRFADGKVSFAYSRVLGLEKGPDGNIVVNHEEAKIVKLIFRLFLEGMTPHSIAVHLTEQGIKSPGGKDKWNGATVRRMLSNEKYKGDALLQKEFTVDYLQKKTKKNEGEVPQYYVEGNHEAIIEPSVFDLAQTELVKRSRKSTARYSGVSIFSNKIKCAECGSWYGSKVWHSNDKYRRVIYRCNHKFDGDRKCETPHVTEEEVKAAFVRAMNTVITERDEIIANIKLIRQTVCGTGALEEERDTLQGEMEVVVELTQNCVAENARTAQNQEEYQKRYSGLVERYEKVKTKYDSIVAAIEEKQAHFEKLGMFIETLEQQAEPITEFDAGMWGSMVEYITVDKDKNMTVTFKDGSEIQA